MSFLSLWHLEFVRYPVGYAAASLVAGAAYWVGDLKAPKIPSLATLCAGVALLGGFILLSSLDAIGDDPAPALILLATIVLGPLQAVFEWKRQSLSRSWWWYLVWSVGLYLGTGLAGGLVNRGVGELTYHYYPVSPLDVMDWIWQNPGYILGLVFAPISISFYRWAVPGLCLRPGIDIPLRLEDEP